MISTLSAGPLGIGDGMKFQSQYILIFASGLGYTNVSLLMWACRKDAVILKPSLPAIPVDAQFVPPSLGGVPYGASILSFFFLSLL